MYITIIIFIIFIVFILYYIYSPKKCYDPKGITITDNNKSLIERINYKYILNNDETKKLLQLKNIFIPSLFDNTYCDYLTTYYYDISDFIDSNQYNSYHRIRIRSYLFHSYQYLELKSKHNKLRIKIDKNYDIINPIVLENIYIKPINNFIKKIKSKKIKPLFKNTYKRYSFVYFDNHEIRITIDTDVFFSNQTLKHTMKQNIMEIKAPYTISESQINQYINIINQKINTNLTILDFSKFDYFKELTNSN
jgi:hypothetical protein